MMVKKKSFLQWRPHNNMRLPFFTKTNQQLVLWITLLHHECESLSAVGSSLVNVQVPSWTDLRTRVLSTERGAQLEEERNLRYTGRGPPHVDATLRLFDTNEDPRVTLYRDSAAWCPYCQKVWIALEEKRISYNIKTVPLNAYGDKPAWFSRLVDGGQLPAIEKDNELITESIDIIKRLDDDFPGNGPRIIPLVSSPEANMAQDLLQLERELQSAWFSLVFYPVEGPALLKARQSFLGMISLVDDALATTPGPWFLGGTSPSFVDIQFVCHVERIIASVLYFKGIQLVGKYPKLDAWLTAWDDRPSYLATKSDFYTLIMSIPSQNGPGYSIPQAKLVASQICGLEGAWDFPIHNNEKDRQEAAFCLMSNHEVIVTFATRGAGESGRPSFQAELADPYAEPNLEFLSSVDICLRYITEALLDGSEVVEARAARVLVGNAGDGTLRPDWYEYSDNDGRRYWWNEETGDATWTAPTMQLDSCLAYLRDRIGVPRDMSEGAAMQLRAYLNWGIDLLNRTS